MTEADTSYESQIKRLEEELTFLDDHIRKQDQEILNLRNKLEKTITELKEFRERIASGAHETPLPDEKPPHY